MTLNFRYLLLTIVPTLILFLPRTLTIGGMYSFRIITVVVLVLLLFLQSGRLKFDSFFKNWFMWFYFGTTVFVYLRFMEIKGLAGFLLDSVVLYVIVTNLINSHKSYQLFVSVLTKMILLYSILCVLEFVTGCNIWNVVTNQSLVQMRYGFYRSFGCMSTPINNGFFMILCMPVIMDAILQNKKNKIYIAAYVLAMITLICTLSRAPILAALVLNLVWLLKRGLFSFMLKHIRIVIIVGIAMFLIVQIPAVSSALTRFVSMFLAITDDSVARSITDSFGVNAEGFGQRVELYDWVWKSVQDSITFGKGPTYPFDYVWIRWDGKKQLKQSIENQYLACLFHFGMAGLVTMIMFYLSLLKRHFNYKEIIKIHTLTVDFLWVTTLLTYFIVILTAAIADDIKLFFVMMALYSVRKRIPEKGIENSLV